MRGFVLAAVADQANTTQAGLSANTTRLEAGFRFTSADEPAGLGGLR